VIVKALVDYIKANSSITTVVPSGTDVNTGNGMMPYIRVFEAQNFVSERYATDNGMTRIVVRVCFPPNNQMALDKVVYYELFQLLDKLVLTITNTMGEVTSTSKIKIDCTSEVTGEFRVENGYIARDRVVTVPTRWR
jgi:hypothetical protein